MNKDTLRDVIFRLIVIIAITVIFGIAVAYTDDKKIGKKFDYIVNRILNQRNMYYDDYVRLSGYENISEIRLFPNGINGRIYCKEMRLPNGNFYIIAVKLLPKKTSNKIDKAIIQFIKPIEQYEYEF